MFTGIVQNLGTVVQVTKCGSGLNLVIRSSLPGRYFKKGNSIAVDGVCLTVEKYSAVKKCFLATAVTETLERSTIADFVKGQRVNLEPPLTLGTPLGGHLVSGHVDGIGRVLRTGADFRLEVPSPLMRFFPIKGSIVVNGVSLTLAKIAKNSVNIALIPETLKFTNLGILAVGDKVNLEVDTVARYLDSLLTARL